MEFEPAEAWKAGDYKLVINMALEDLAGNRIGRPLTSTLSTVPPGVFQSKPRP